MDPFTKTFNALWDLAEASQTLCDLVKLKNRIKFNPTKDAMIIKDEVSEADTPELILVTTDGSGNLLNTTSTSMAVLRFDWMISTATLSVTQKLLPVEFALFAAMVEWPTVLTALTWNSVGFVKRVNFTSRTSGIDDATKNRGIRGWSSVWSIEVEMWFSTQQLIAHNTVPGT